MTLEGIITAPVILKIGARILMVQTIRITIIRIKHGFYEYSKAKY